MEMYLGQGWISSLIKDYNFILPNPKSLGKLFKYISVLFKNNLIFRLFSKNNCYLTKVLYLISNLFNSHEVSIAKTL